MQVSRFTQPQISTTSWTSTPDTCPGEVGFPTQANFPAGLIWSGKGEVPAIGARVQIYLNNIGPATVMAYFHYDGYLGVLVAPDTMPAHLQNQQPAITLCHAYGIDLEPRPPRPSASLCVLAPAAPQQSTSTDWIPDYPEAAREAPDEVRYYRYQEHSRVTVVRGALSDYFRFYDALAFTGTDAQDSAQLADPSKWTKFPDYQFLEVRPTGEVRVMEVRGGLETPVMYCTTRYPGPFRIPGHQPFTATDEADQYATLRDLATEFQQSAPAYRGRTVERKGRWFWYAFEEEGMGDRPSDWAPVELTLAAQPLDSYGYNAGQRADAEHPAQGQATLWQEQGGEGRYFVEVAPSHAHAPAFSYLEEERPDRLRTWWRFQLEAVPA